MGTTVTFVMASDCPALECGVSATALASRMAVDVWRIVTVAGGRWRDRLAAQWEIWRSRVLIRHGNVTIREGSTMSWVTTFRERDETSPRAWRVAVHLSVGAYASAYLHASADSFTHSPLMISREKLLEAAARVYAEAGFRGSTTRRIAEAAGVNEVTIFRLFGSKGALLEAAVRHFAPMSPEHALPVEPIDPESELTAWASMQLEYLRHHASMIRKALAEVEELPVMGTQTCEGCARGQHLLRRYARKLCDRWGSGSTRDVDLEAAVTMLASVILNDAISRDVMPAVFPPAGKAAAAYVRVFLRALGVPTSTENGRRKLRSRVPARS